MASHPLLQAFKASKPAFGAWITLSSPFAARTVAAASPHLSWLVLDCEHGLTPLQPGAAETVAAVSGLGQSAPSILVRVPATGPAAEASATWQIKYALDAGARGVIVPMVSTAEQAQAVVSAARFPPVGTRGYGSPYTQASWGVSAADYLKIANESVLVLTQVETPQAYANIEAICAVEGLDGVFIGPYDLSLSLGLPAPNPDPHPEVEKAIQKILEVAHKANKKCAIYCISGEQSARRAKEGFDMINVTSDVGAMTDALKAHLAVAAGESTGGRGFGY
ncbi:phosphoenolpyruvate/pyruvate domain-containing protein [Phanerochaete sordida]|uniref:Phosphoenolpyruvate/pyruvate domain-containing protein n=1 Tax=Phanerochaete sordida TaxID=48140 RepID=A0A9P3G1V3_9APHY|nr:phosphoenolpyruvate/pyruvate domain-containing protein [Phanerochaete sordida]